MSRPRNVLLTVTAVVALAAAPAQARTPPRSAVPAVAPGANACGTLQDGTGQAVPKGCLDPETHTDLPAGLPAVAAPANAALQHVGNNAGLKALVSTPARIYRDGFATGGDGGAAVYTYSGTACPKPDDGAQVAARSGGCWMMDPVAIPPDVRQWGASVSRADNLAPIQAALTAAVGPRLRIPSVYAISGCLSNTSSLYLDGLNKDNSGLIVTATSGCVLNFPDGGGMSNLFLDYRTMPLSGSALLVSGGRGVFSDFYIDKSFTGIEVTGTANKFHDFEIATYASIGIWVHGPNDDYFSHFILNAGSPSYGAFGGIRLTDRAEAIVFTDGDVLGGLYDLTTDATDPTPGHRPAFNRFSNVYFDGATNGSLINNLFETPFIGGWFSAGRPVNADGTPDPSGTSHPGLTIVSGAGISFTSTQFVNNGSHGALIKPGASQITFSNCAFDANSATAGSGVADGLHVQAGASYISVTGGTAGQLSGFPGLQGAGVSIEGGASTGIVVQGVMCGGPSGNKVACVYDGTSPSAAKSIQGDF